MTAAGEPTRVERSSALYARLLGPAWLDLHPAIRSLHLTAGAATGRFEFLRGRGLAARLACWVLRLPSSATALDVRLRSIAALTPRDGRGRSVGGCSSRPSGDCLLIGAR